MSTWVPRAIATRRFEVVNGKAQVARVASPTGGPRAETPDATKTPRPVPFAQARGTLPWPVAGMQVLGFGQPTAYGMPSNGIVIQGRPGSPVVSPCDGLLVYAGEFRTYGPLVIISAGDGYHCLLAGRLRIDTKVGEQLSAGDPIGALSADGAAPRLHLELLKDQRPIDPAPWLRKR